MDHRNGNDPLGNGLPSAGMFGQGLPVSMQQALGIPSFQQMQVMPQMQPGMGFAMSNPLGMPGPNPHAELLATKPSPAPKFKKAPDAPKRFKSAFIIFSAEKHKQIKEEFAKEGRSEKTTDIAKMVSEAWRQMDAEEKEVWEKMARKDKARYEVEKAMYKGPWKVPANKRTPKDPTAPKRPMSAFLAFSNKRRAGLKRENPDATNADLSKMLSKTWKEAPDDLRKKYMDEEADLRAKYKVAMAAWRKKVAEEKRQEREEREAIALKHAEAQQNEQPTQPQADQQQSNEVPSQAIDQSQLFNPYMAQMGNLLVGSGGMQSGAADPSQQYASLMANNFAAQQQFSLPQQQLLSQLFNNTQQLKYPGGAGMYPGLQGQFAFQGQQQQPLPAQSGSSPSQGMPGMTQQQAAQNFAMQQQQLQQQLAMAQAMQQQQMQQPMQQQMQQQMHQQMHQQMMDQQQQQQQQEMMMAQQQYGMPYQGEDQHANGNDEQEPLKDTEGEYEVPL